MRFSTRIPALSLRDSVAMIWHWQDYDKPHAMKRLMPNGEMTLIVNLHEDVVRVYDKSSLRLKQTTRGAVLVGAHVEPLVIDSEEQKHVFGIQFRPGAAFLFFRQPAHELLNAQVDLEDLWRGADLRARLLACGGDSDACYTNNCTTSEPSIPPCAMRYIAIAVGLQIWFQPQD